MPILDPERPSNWFANPYLWLAVVVFAVLAIPFCTRAHSEWDSVYIRAALELRAGRDVYHEQFGYTYPPFQMMLALPFAELDRLPRRLGFFALNVACCLWMVSSAWAISGGRPLRGAGLWSRSEHAIFLLGLGCGAWYSLHALAHQQTDLIVAALVFAGCRMLQTGHSWRGAAMFGVAAAMKCTPLLFAPYLIFRRRFAAAALVVIVAGGVSLLPDLVNRCPNDATWLTEWYALYLRPMSSRSYTPGMWASDVLYNQSISGAVNRWQLTDWTWTGPTVAIAPTATPTSPSRLRALILGIDLTLLAAGGFLFRRRTRLSPATIVGDASWSAYEYGVLVILMVLFSPMSSIPHFCTLILPGFCLARYAVERRNRVVGMLVGLAIVLAALSNKDLQGAPLYTLALWHGLVMANAVVLLAGLFWVLARLPAHVATDLALRASRFAMAKSTTSGSQQHVSCIATPRATDDEPKATHDLAR